jgi:hypothetical protein
MMTQDGPAMRTTPSVPRVAAIPELDGRYIRPTSDYPPGQAGGPAEVVLHLVHNRDRMAGDMDETVVPQLFSAGLTLQTVLELMNGHPGATKVREAIGQLDRAIRDLRDLLFEHHQPHSPSAGQPGHGSGLGDELLPLTACSR